MEFSVRFGFRKMISCASFREFDPKDMARFESKDKRFVLSVEFSLDLMNTGLRDASAHTIHLSVAYIRKPHKERERRRREIDRERERERERERARDRDRERDRETVRQT